MFGGIGLAMGGGKVGIVILGKGFQGMRRLLAKAK
jgi:hypothetical protein